MAKTTGYMQLVCDRCGETAYAADGGPIAQQWRDVAHVGADGSTSTRYLCPDCYAAWRTLAAAQDSAFGDFMANKAVG